jgi:ABC-2 type transport system permease protein
MNHSIHKEFHIYMRTKRSWWILAMYQLILIAIMAVAYGTTYPGVYVTIHVEIGKRIFYSILIAQLGVLMLLTPALSGGSLKRECQQKQMRSLLSAFVTWWGKFASSFLYMGLLWISSLPILSLSIALRGASGKELVKGLVITGILIGSCCSIGLLCASLFRRSANSIALAYAFVISINVLPFALVAVLQKLSFSESGWKYAPILINPFCCMITTMVPYEWHSTMLTHFYYMLSKTYPKGDIIWKDDWIISISFYVLTGFFSAIFAIRNIRRAIR